MVWGACADTNEEKLGATHFCNDRPLEYLIVQVKGAYAEVTQHPRSGHHEHAGALQGPECFDPFEQFTGETNQEASEESDYRVVVGARCFGSEVLAVAVGHWRCTDVVSCRCIFGVWTNAVHACSGQVLARVMDDGFQGVLIPQVLRAKVSEKADCVWRQLEVLASLWSGTGWHGSTGARIAREKIPWADGKCATWCIRPPFGGTYLAGLLRKAPRTLSCRFADYEVIWRVSRGDSQVRSKTARNFGSFQRYRRARRRGSRRSR